MQNILQTSLNRELRTNCAIYWLNEILRKRVNEKQCFHQTPSLKAPLHLSLLSPCPNLPIIVPYNTDNQSKARFKRRATAVPNSIDPIKFNFSTAVARRLKPSRATRQ